MTSKRQEKLHPPQRACPAFQNMEHKGIWVFYAEIKNFQSIFLKVCQIATESRSGFLDRLWVQK